MTPNPNPSPELLPCPFCGGEGEAVCLRAGEDSVLSWVRCLSCHAKTAEIEDAYSDLPTARANWNTRALSPQTLPAPGEVELRETIANIIDAMVSGPILSNIEGGKVAHRLDQLAAADRILATVAAANDEGVRERVAKALADRFIERGNARVTGSVHASWDDMPWSYRKDFLADADAALRALATSGSQHEGASS
ncbi:Lar family restriction alleviation protein [Sphingomonas faeni]|uniref:Lar family restriction alleviation protein n=1 Tax=Sphingomonas faeni TaxID=185950 RepID=UPI003351C5ED